MADRVGKKVSYVSPFINESRAEHNLPAVGIDEELTDMSQSHAADTATHFDDSTDESRRATYIGHDSSDGRDLGDRVRNQNIKSASAFGENVAFRYRGPITDVAQMIEESIRIIHEGMMAELPPDDGHRKTILGDYTHVGVGLEFLSEAETEDLNTLFFVTDFGMYTDRRSIENPAPGPRPSVMFNKNRAHTPDPRPSRRTSRSTRDRVAAMKNKGDKTNVIRVTYRGRRRGEIVQQTIQTPVLPIGESLQEKRAKRIAARKKERLQRLQERVEWRKMLRIQRRSTQ
jgi:hypothetical protein